MTDQSQHQASNIERKWWVAGIATIPAYLVIALMIGQLGPFTWVLAFIGAMLGTGLLYRLFVFRLVDRGFSPWYALAWWVAIQFIAISLIIWALQSF
ncbi:hypothetical protein [Marinobacter confluentis]|uniref:Uncharacterized protein n=1 Tax=Marinobacter confluentis TaxID=1697557 RepID=A0A4Z1C860_9GAMM|nr:hypothetical protein [Marinobacter confluentis]TGN41840.1 hypothetical protein E5Q11_04785 [Marinobacter confluentis]